MGRAPCCDKENVKKGPWSPEEDDKLKAYIEQYGTGGNWIALPQKIGLKRCGKSCRLRWLNYLRPNIKHGGFSEEEDNIICSLYISIGSRWSIIAAQLPGRTDNDIKNYWNTKLKKKLLGKRKQSINNHLSSTSPDRVKENSSSQTLSNSAQERLQLHMQLQNLQNPFTFYNNPALWPKLHPFQEKLLLQSLTESSNTLVQPILPIRQQGNGQKIHTYQEVTASLVIQPDVTELDNSKVDGSENSLNAVASSDSSIPGNYEKNLMDSTFVSKQDALEESAYAIPHDSFQAELEDILNNNTSGLMAQQDQISEFDRFKEVNGSMDNLIWCYNEFQTKSTSLNSWTCSSVLQSEGIFQDFELGCDMYE